MEYSEAIKILTDKKHFQINLGLDRIANVLNKLGNPQNKLKYIHVAGTNGKGSVCAILSTILTQAGIKTGLYASPHIFDYTERIKINNVDITKIDFAKYLDKIIKTIPELSLTEFEILTVIMFMYFADNNVEVVVLETGLGGRFDATNVIKNNICSIITHIDYDHTELLGHTLDKIALEKAGIVKENCPLITSEGYDVFRNITAKKNSNLILTLPYITYEDFSLKGIHQKENLSLAITCVKTFFRDISDKVIQDALKKVKHPYRFQQIKSNLIVDVAHNPNGIDVLCKNLELYYPDTEKRVIFGCLKNKDYKKMISMLSQYELYYYHFNYPNSATIEELQKIYNAKEYKNKFTDDKLMVVCGSFYMLKELLPKI